MRIAHLSCVAPPDIGGIGRVAAQEVGLLQQRSVDAYQVSLTTHAGFRFGNMGSISALDHLVRDADVVHLHYPFYGTAGAVAQLRRKNVIKKLVLTLHMDATAGGIRGLTFDIHRRLFQDRILATADALIVSSRDYAASSSYRSWAEKSIEIPFGVDENLFLPGVVNVERFGLTHRPVIGFVGGMDTAHAFKGIEILLEAMVGLKDAQLLLIGDGNARKRYEAFADRLGLTSRCFFAGKLNDAEVITAYQSMDVLAVPSTSAAEAFSLVALEAQACGVPVVASNLPGVRTVVADRETGFLVPVKDVENLTKALQGFIGDEERRNFFGKAARQRVLERFTWTRHIEKLMEVYKKLI